MICTNAISNLIREGKTFQIDSAMQVGGKDGMVLLNKALLKHVQDGLIEPQEALNRSINRRDMMEQLKSTEIDTSTLVAED